jgi:hypothetical protein
MKALLFSLTLLAWGLLSLPVFAQTPEAVIGTCKDGTTFTAAPRRGACRGHGGVQAANPAATMVTPAPAAGTPPAPAVASGGGAGQVWVNTKSKVYHCQGDRYYGKTKVGAYMSEAAAKAAGDRPDHGKNCS